MNNKGILLKHYAVVFCAAMLQGCALTQSDPDSNADMEVDLADSLNIAGFHKDKDDIAPALATEPAQQAATAEIIVRSDYRPAAGPTSAYTALHQMLYRTCPRGWHKNKEWTAAEDGGFFLYLSANCR